MRFEAFTRLVFLDQNGAQIVHVKLPLPTRIDFDSSYNWEAENLGQMVNLGAKAYGSHGVAQAADSIKKMGVATALGGLGNEQKFGAATVGKYGTGKAPNPFQQIIFQGASQREFNCDFSITAQNQSEMQTYLTMLNQLYYMAAPALKDNAAFLAWPNTCTLSILEGDTKIIRDRKCAIKSIKTDLTPDGAYMRFQNGAPVHVTLNIMFIELFIPIKQSDDEIFGFGDPQSGNLQGNPITQSNYTDPFPGGP